MSMTTTLLPDTNTFCTSVHDSLSMCESTVSSAFFSRVNVSYLQLRLRNEFFEETGVVVDAQREEDLLALMRYVYVSRARNIPTFEAEQLAELNNHVIRSALPMVRSAVRQHMGYLRDASQLAVPMARAQATTIKGERPLSSSAAAAAGGPGGLSFAF